MNGNLKRVMAAFLSFAMVASTPIQYVQAADEETATKAAESEAAVSEAKEESLPTLDDAIKSENPIDIYKDTGDKFLKGLTDEESYKYMILVRYNLTEKIQKDRQSLNEDIEKYVDISKNWTDRKPECKTEEETKQLDEQLAKWEDEISASLGEKEYIKDEKTVKTSDSKSYHEYLAAITKIDAEKCLKLLSDITDAQNDEELTKAKEAFVDFNESVYGFDEEKEPADEPDGESEGAKEDVVNETIVKEKESEKKTDEKSSTVIASFPDFDIYSPKAYKTISDIKYEEGIIEKELPKTIKAKMEDGTVKDIAVKWVPDVDPAKGYGYVIYDVAFPSEYTLSSELTEKRDDGTIFLPYCDVFIDVEDPECTAQLEPAARNTESIKQDVTVKAVNLINNEADDTVKSIADSTKSLTENLRDNISLASTNGSTATLSQNQQLYYNYPMTNGQTGQNNTCYFSVATDAGIFRAYCGKAVAPTPGNGGYTLYQYTDGTRLLKVKLLLMFGEGGPWQNEGDALTGQSGANIYCYLHEAVSLAYSGTTAFANASAININNHVQNYINGSEPGRVAEAANYDVYCIRPGGNYQDVVWLEKKWVDPGKHMLRYNANGGHIKDISSQASSEYKIIPNGDYYIGSALGSSIYMHGSGTNCCGPEVVIWNSKSENAQQTIWTFERYKDTPWYIITNKLSGKALRAYTENGTNSCQLQNQELNSYFIWRLKDLGNGQIAIINQATGKALDVNYSKTDNGTRVISYSYAGTTNQKWTLETIKTEEFASRRKMYGTRVYITGTVPVKDGYTFKNWNTKQDGTGTSYSSEQDYTLDKNSDTTLYAQWTKNIPFTYYGNGGTYDGGETFIETASPNSSYKFKENFFTRPGYTFKYWTEDAKEHENSIGLEGKNFSINNSCIKDVFIGKRSFDSGYEVLVRANNLTEVYAPTWTEIRGQDDLEWKKLDKGSWTRNGITYNYGITIFLKDHYYDFSIYNTHIYGLDASHNTTSNAKEAVKIPKYTVAISSGYKISAVYAKSLYAQWRANKFTVHFDSNGGSGTMSNQTFTYDEAQNLYKNAFSKNNYLFIGWNTKSDGTGTTYQDQQSVKNLTTTDGDTITLYAQWLASKYTNTLNYDANGGSGAPASQTATVTFPNTQNTFTVSSTKPTRTGYTLAGWYDAATGGNKIGSTVAVGSSSNAGNQSKTIYAHWTANQYTNTLSYNANGGSGAPTSQTATVTFPNTQSSFTVSSTKPTRTGYTFAGWYDAASGGNKIGSTVTVGSSSNAGNQSKTIYAHWTANQYTNTLSYNANGGSGAPDSQTATVTFPNTQNTFTVSSTKPTRTGYTFAGWYDAATGGNKIGTTVTVGSSSNAGNQSKTIYAHWTANQYTVSYDANGGTGSMSADTVTYGTNYTTKANSFTRTGYTFIGWNEKADGTGTDWTNWIGKPWNWSYTKNITLYAQWKINSYTLTITGDEGVEKITGSGTYNYGTAVPATYKIKTGYHLVKTTGTTYEGNSNGVWTEHTNKEGLINDTWNIGTCNRAIVVHTAPNTYMISYNGNGSSGGSTASSNHTYDTAKNLTKNGYTKDGYTFKNWNTKANGTGTSYSDQESVKNLTSTNGGTVTLYAQWTPNTYTVSFDGNGATSGTMSSQAYVFDTAKALSANRFSRAYTVSFNTNGGTINSSSKATATAKFNGWEDRNNYVREGINYSYTSFDAPYYANTYNDLMNAYGYNKYRLLNHYVLYGKNEGRTPKGSSAGLYPNGATVNNLTTTNRGSVTLYANWTLGSVTLPTPSKTGYIFDGWYDANGNKIPGSAYTPTGNTVITAHWTAIKYAVTYNSNKPSTASGSVTGTTASSKHTYDTAQNLTANGYKLTGWTFTGWNTKQDGKGTAYKDKESVKNLTSENGKTITLYAQWRPNTYTVVYNGNSATGGNTANSFHVYDTAKNLNKNGYTKENHTFIGWSNGSGTEYKDQQSVKNLTATDKGTVTLYAKWDKAPELTSEKQEYYEGETVTRDMLLAKVKANDREDGDISKKVIITKLAYPAGKLVNGKKQAAYEKSWTTGMPETEKLDTWFMQLDKKDAPVTIKMTCKVTDKVGNITEKTFDVLLKYNEFPTIDAENRAFTWNEANAGLITEDALLKDQIAKGKLSAHDTEDDDVTNKIKILDYNEKDFTSLEASGTVAVTFSVTDKFGKETTRQVNIMIVKQDVLSDIEPVKVVRFINEKYYKKNAGINLKTITKAEEAERNQNGGLNVRSKWYTEDDYRSYINTVWNKTSGDTYTYTKSDLDNIKAYIDANGIGNAEKPNGLSGFVRKYMSNSFKD